MHQANDEVIQVVRQFDHDLFSDFDAYTMITRMVYWTDGGDYNYGVQLVLPGEITEVVFAAYLEVPPGSQDQHEKAVIKGANAKCHVSHSLEKFAKTFSNSEGQTFLQFHFMPPSFSCLIKTSSRREVKNAIRELKEYGEEEGALQMGKRLFEELPLSFLNHFIYRCE